MGGPFLARGEGLLERGAGLFPAAVAQVEFRRWPLLQEIVAGAALLSARCQALRCSLAFCGAEVS
jgi:hypothetical protein